MAGPTEGGVARISSINQMFAIAERMKTDPQTLCDLFGQYERSAALGSVVAPAYGVVLYGDAEKYGNFDIGDWSFISAACAKCADGSLYVLGEPRKGGLVSIIVEKKGGANILGYDEKDFLDLAARNPSERDAAEEAFFGSVGFDGWRLEGMVNLYGFKFLGFHSSDDDIYPSAKSFAKALSLRTPVVELYAQRSLDAIYSLGDETLRHPER